MSNKTILAERPVNTSIVQVARQSSPAKTTVLNNREMVAVKNDNVEPIARGPGRFNTIPAEIAADLRKWGVTSGKDLLWPKRADEIVRYLKSHFNIPDSVPLFIFSNEEGDAWVCNSDGEAVLEGHIYIYGADGSVNHIGLSFNANRQKLYLDGEEVKRNSVPELIKSLTEDLAASLPIDRLMDRAAYRAQTIYFQGELAESKGEESVVLTQNYLAPHDLHLFIGNVDSLKPVALNKEVCFRNNLGVIRKGKTEDNEEISIFIPFKHNSRNHLMPSLNGKRLKETKLSLQN